MMHESVVNLMSHITQASVLSGKLSYINPGDPRSLMQRIESLDRSLAAQLQRLPPESRVAVVRGICRELSASFPSLPPEIHSAIEHIGAASGDLHRSVTQAAEQLDERYLDLLDSDSECANEFALARAAAAVSFALEPDAVEHCVYEANFAFGDVEKIKSVVDDVTAQRSPNNVWPLSCGIHAANAFHLHSTRALVV
jgi:hypothetical protein